MSNKGKAAQVAKRIDEAEQQLLNLDAQIDKLRQEKVHQSKAVEAAAAELKELLAAKDQTGETQLLDLGEGRFCVVSFDQDQGGLSTWFGTPR